MFGIQIQNSDGEWNWLTSWSEHDGSRSRVLEFPLQSTAEVQAQQLELKNYRIERIVSDVTG